MQHTPYDLVKLKHKLPEGIVDRPFQVDVINDLAPRKRAGYYLEVGTGKTLCSTVAALYKYETEQRTTIVIVPPILVPSWCRWLQKFGGVRHLDYRGSPKVRKSHNLAAYQFIVMTIGVFKNDYEHLIDALGHLPLTLLVDEATCLKNIESGNYKYVKNTLDKFDSHFMALTGTPLATPGDGYAYVRLLAPDVYRNHKQFETIHVGEKDFFGHVTVWQNLEILKDNMKINSQRVLRNEVLTVPEPIIDPKHYDLYPDQYRLYKAIVDQELDKIPNKDVIDKATEGQLYSYAQQIIWNFNHFNQSENLPSASWELYDELIEELGTLDKGGRKLVVFANFRLSMAGAHERFNKKNIGILNGDFTPTQKQDALKRFQDSDTFNQLWIHPLTAGKGVDGLQHVCSDALIAENLGSTIDVGQCIGRIARDGQEQTPLIRWAVANRTVQVNRHRQLLKNDEQAGFVQQTYKSLRASLYGEEL